MPSTVNWLGPENPVKNLEEHDDQGKFTSRTLAFLGLVSSSRMFVDVRAFFFRNYSRAYRKMLILRHSGESRNPEVLENTGSLLSQG
jgi:hypothetical protein